MRGSEIAPVECPDRTYDEMPGGPLGPHTRPVDALIAAVADARSSDGWSTADAGPGDALVRTVDDQGAGLGAEFSSGQRHLGAGREAMGEEILGAL